MGPGRISMQLLRGVAVEFARQRQAIISDSASVAPLSSHEIWLRQADGQEISVTLNTNAVQLLAGQPLSVLGRQHRGAFQPFMVINEATGAVIETIAVARWGLCGMMGQLRPALPAALVSVVPVCAGLWELEQICAVSGCCHLAVCAILAARPAVCRQCNHLCERASTGPARRRLISHAMLMGGVGRFWLPPALVMCRAAVYQQAGRGTHQE